MRTLTLIACLLLLPACHRTPKAAVAGSSRAATKPATPEQEAQVLGHEIYDLVDRAMSYRSSHRGRFPRSLRELGMDELTRTTSRSLTLHGRSPEVTIAFRDTTGRRLASCLGTPAILEDATIRGSYTLTCTYVGGGATSFTVPR